MSKIRGEIKVIEEAQGWFISFAPELDLMSLGEGVFAYKFSSKQCTLSEISLFLESIGASDGALNTKSERVFAFKGEFESEQITSFGLSVEPLPLTAEERKQAIALYQPTINPYSLFGF